MCVCVCVTQLNMLSTDNSKGSLSLVDGTMLMCINMLTAIASTTENTAKEVKQSSRTETIPSGYCDAAQHGISVQTSTRMETAYKNFHDDKESGQGHSGQNR